MDLEEYEYEDDPFYPGAGIAFFKREPDPYAYPTLSSERIGELRELYTRWYDDPYRGVLGFIGDEARRGHLMTEPEEDWLHEYHQLQTRGL